MLEVVDEDEEQERAEHTPLGHPILDVHPVGARRGVHTAHTSGGEEGADPQPGFACDARIVDSLEEDGVVDTVECLLDVEEEHRALWSGCTLDVQAQDALDGAEEVVDGVVGGAALAEAELGVGEVVAILQLLSKAWMRCSKVRTMMEVMLMGR